MENDKIKNFIYYFTHYQGLSKEQKKKRDELLARDCAKSGSQNVVVSTLRGKEHDQKVALSTLEHDCEFVTRFLHMFSENDCPLKYTTHAWDRNNERQYSYENFDDFKEQYMNVLNSTDNNLDGFDYESHPELFLDIPDKRASLINILSIRANALWKTVSSFLVQTGTKYSWGEYSLRIGYNEYLKKWMNENPQEQPSLMPLTAMPEDCRPQNLINDKMLSRFDDVIDVFKHCIQFRDNDLYFMVKKMFRNSDLVIDKSAIDTLKGRTFYTDTETVKEVMGLIKDNMTKRPNYPNVVVQCVTSKENNLKIICLEFLQQDSFSNRDIKDEKLKVDGNEGDLHKIQNKLKNLCDFSVESVFRDGEMLKPMRINYLSSENHKNDNKYEEIGQQDVQGFKYILRFYEYIKKL